VKEYKTDQYRNIALVAHGDAGKTTLAEAMCFTAGISKRLGRIDAGNTLSDYNPDEIDRSISISTALLHFDWGNHRIHLLDTPGYADFIGEVMGAIRVVDGAIVLIHAVSGIEVGTEKVWEMAAQQGKPRLIFINKMDKEHADFYKVLSAARERFGNGVVPVQLPIGQAGSFKGIVDLMKMKGMLFESGGMLKETDIPEDMQAMAAEHRERLVEAAAESDDALLEKYFDQGDLSAEEIAKGIRQGTLSGQVFPVLSGDAFENRGVRSLLDAMIAYLPSPEDMGAIKGLKPDTQNEEIRQPSDDQPLSALVFKTISEPHVGELSLFRVYSGVLKSGMDVLNTSKGGSERIGQVYAMIGKERKEVGSMHAGEMGAVVKLKDTHTGNTLSAQKAPIVLPGVAFPEPVIRVAIEPRTKGDEEKISSGLNRLHDEDPTFITEVDGELKQTVISGLGELHLDVIVGRLKRKFGVDVELVKPRIPYRETIQGTAQVQGKYKKQTGGRGQYGDTWIKIEPLPRGTGFEFDNGIVGGVIPTKFIPAVEKGIKEAMNDGAVAGYPIVDLKVTLYDGSFHTVDSSEMAFKIAGSMALKKAVVQASPVLLEPIYDVEVTVPEDFMGDVMGDLSSRRGKILGVDPKGSFQMVKAKVPLAELYRYSTTLRSLTQGRGIHARHFSHYEEVPRDVSEKIITEARED
jgi:elongation factor G